MRWRSDGEAETGDQDKETKAKHHCGVLSVRHPTRLAPLAALGGQTKEEGARQRSTENQ